MVTTEMVSMDGVMRFVAGFLTDDLASLRKDVRAAVWWDGEIDVPVVYVGDSKIVLSGVDGPPVIDGRVYSARHILRQAEGDGPRVAVLAEATPSSHYSLAMLDTRVTVDKFGEPAGGSVRRLRPLHGDPRFRQVMREADEDWYPVHADESDRMEAALMTFAAGDAVEVFDEATTYAEGVEVNGSKVVASRVRTRVCVLAKQGNALRVFDDDAWERRKDRVLRGSRLEIADPRGAVRA